jgi:hypothetical protein
MSWFGLKSFKVKMALYNILQQQRHFVRKHFVCGTMAGRIVSTHNMDVCSLHLSWFGLIFQPFWTLTATKVTAVGLLPQGSTELVEGIEEHLRMAGTVDCIRTICDIMWLVSRFWADFLETSWNRIGIIIWGLDGKAWKTKASFPFLVTEQIVQYVSSSKNILL